MNYNGSRFLTECLKSLEHLDTEGHRVGVNVVDNGSTDRSEEIVKSFPGFNFIPLRKNLGFSKGNNQGVRIRLRQLANQNYNPDYLMFLNNDTTVDRSMIVNIDKTFNSDEKIGIVGLRSLFMNDFIPLSMNSVLAKDQFVDIEVKGENIGRELRRYRVCKGHQIAENKWRLSNDSCLFIPVVDSSLASFVSLQYFGMNSSFSLLKSFYRKDNSFHKEHLVKISQLSFDALPSQYVKLIQNAGSFVSTRFEAGDMGSFEIDRGQYDRDRELDAVCGVAMTIRAKLFEELGGFDENFFAYYEDTDLSLRARRKGYKCFYSGKALIHHVHAGSSGVGTDYFKFNVNFSRLYFLSKFASSSIYSQLLSEIKFGFRTEFELYLQDGVVENKPNLKTYAKYLRFWIKFYFNRIARVFCLRRDKKMSSNFLKERYVNEY